MDVQLFKLNSYESRLLHTGLLISSYSGEFEYPPPFFWLKLNMSKIKTS